MPRGKATRWIVENGTRGPVTSTAPWRRGARGEAPIDGTCEFVIDAYVIDPNQIDIWEATDELDVEALPRTALRRRERRRLTATTTNTAVSR
jgi:hypothetical protein